jgi:hypothetical protein
MPATPAARAQSNTINRFDLCSGHQGDRTSSGMRVDIEPRRVLGAAGRELGLAAAAPSLMAFTRPGACLRGLERLRARSSAHGSAADAVSRAYAVEIGLVLDEPPVAQVWALRNLQWRPHPEAPEHTVQSVTAGRPGTPPRGFPTIPCPR